MQWHPLFAQLLRPLVEDFYEVSTNLPVGDLPRQADIVLLRRTAPAPFVGIWRHLTTWNVLEFKGPSDDPALRDLDLLLELGLGIDRRLNEERHQQRLGLLERAEVSWWYLANHLGGRFRAEVQQVLGGPVEELAEGLWRCPALGRMLYLVSRDTLPVDRESVPLHLVTEEPLDRVQALAREVVQQPGFWDLYGEWLARLHPDVWPEVQDMIRKMGKEPDLDPTWLIDEIGPEKLLAKYIKKHGLKPVIDTIGLKQVIDQVGLKQVIDQVGLKQVIDQVGPKQVLAEVGAAEVIAAVGIERLLAEMTPEQVEELKRRLT